MKLTRAKYEEMTFDELMEWAIEYLDDVTDEEILKDVAMCKLRDDDFGMALHIIQAIYDNPYSTMWYRYDYCMGKLQTPSPITEKADIEDLLWFEEDKNEN